MRLVFWEGNQVAFFTFVHSAETDERAMRNGAADAAASYAVAALTFFEAATDFVLTMQRQRNCWPHRMMCPQQRGGTTHEDVMTGVRLIGDIIPDFDHD